MSYGSLVRIRSTHPYQYRSGEWGTIVSVVWSKSTSRPCYLIVFDDGATDIWPIDDEMDVRYREFKREGSDGR